MDKARVFLRDCTFEARHSSRGHFLWAWSFFAPRPVFCLSTSPTLLWTTLVVLPVTLSLGVTEIVVRSGLHDDDLRRYGGRADWALDLGYVVWLLYITFNVLRCVFSVVYTRIEDEKMRDPSRQQPALAAIARAAYSISIPSAFVLLIVYIVLAAKGHRMHPHTSAFYAVNACFALLDLVFFEVHIQFEHCVWALALGAVWVFPLSMVHYAMTDATEKRPYVYGCADWSHPVSTLVYFLATVMLTVGVYAAIAAFCDWKHSKPGSNVYVPFDSLNDEACAEEHSVCADAAPTAPTTTTGAPYTHGIAFMP